MTKSELVERLAKRQPMLTNKDMELAVNSILAHIAETLEQGERVEVRSFGSFCLHYRQARTGRNPKTGAPVSLASKHVPFFKAGKALRTRVNGSWQGARLSTPR